MTKITYTTSDISSYIDEFITSSCLFKLVNTTCPPNWKSSIIRNWFHFVAVFDHELSNVRIYTDGYLDKVMVSGTNKDGVRTKIFIDKYPKRKKVRKRWFYINQSERIES